METRGGSGLCNGAADQPGCSAVTGDAPAHMDTRRAGVTRNGYVSSLTTLVLLISKEVSTLYTVTYSIISDEDVISCTVYSK